MKNLIGRRQFIQTAGAAAAGVTLPGIAAASAGPAAESGMEPRLFVGCCAYAFRKYLASGKMTMEDFIRKGVELRVHGVDLTGYWLKSMEPGYLASIRHLGFKSGMPFSGAACGVSMVEADPAKRAEGLEEIKKWVDATDMLGASHLRVFAGKLPPGSTMDEAVGWVVDTMKRACDYAGAKGITLGIEDHSGVTQTADVCIEMMQKIDSPYAGINLDIGHFIPSPGNDQYKQIEACIPYATHTHLHRIFDGGETIDFDRVWQMFAKGGYKGYMSVEYEGKEDAMIAVPKFVERVRALCAKYSTA